MSRLPDIIFVVVLTATASILMAKPADQEITLTPAEPIQSVNFHPALFPGETVNFTVNIHDGEVNGKIYVFDGNPGIKLNNQQSLWTHQGNKDIKNKLEFEALNVGHENETISVEVSALWKSNSSGGGGGGDGSSSPDEIAGLATGTAYTQRHLFLWQYQQRLQFADDASTIGFKVSATCDGALANLADYHVVGAMGWTITQHGNDKITGTVRSKSASKDQLEIHYNQILQGTSPDEIAFANFDLAIAKYGKAGNLPEDRLPHHQVAQPPHEMNPGAIVIAPFASAEEGEENLTSNTRTRLTLKGNQPAIPGGTYTLSAANNLTKLKIYETEQGGEPIKLPKTFSNSDLTQPLTFHIGAESFGAEDMPQTGKLTLTYQLPLLADNAKHELKDEVMVNLLPVEVAVDADRNGEITFDGKDKTTAEKPYHFWVNNDRDIGHKVDETDWEQDDVDAPVSEWDAVQPGMEYRRDLEDLTRIWIDLSAISEVYPTSNASLELKVRIEPTVGQPMINLFQPVEENGGRQYLQDENTGYNQLQDDYGQELCREIGATSVVLPRRAWENLPQDKIIHLLFEGVDGGTGELFFELWEDGEKIFDFPAIHLVLTDVRKMYETWTVGDVEGFGVQWNTWPQTSATQTTGQDLPEPETEEEKDYVLFIHGWNMEGWEKAAFADTMFKRMWHQGYKGRFGAFRWPTFWGLSGLDDWSTLHTSHYDGSEQRAWNSAAPLASLTSSLAGTFKDSSGNSLVRFYAHSMGNVVASEALRQMAATSNVHTYISAQAAIPAHVWDNTTPEMNYGGIQGPTTPNVYGYYWQTGVTTEPHLWESENRPSYMAPQYMPTTRFINHYNPSDWALAAGKWQLNQKLKPNANYDYHFPLFEQKKYFLHQPFPTISKLLFPDDRYEIFSYAAESRSYATGTEGAAGGKFNVAQSANLRTLFNFEEEHKGHSAQFRSFIQKRWSYWEKALEDMRIIIPAGN